MTAPPVGTKRDDDNSHHNAREELQQQEKTMLNNHNSHNSNRQYIPRKPQRRSQKVGAIVSSHSADEVWADTGPGLGVGLGLRVEVF